MRIVNLVENTPGNTGCSYEHGLSFYIETKKHRILMDMGSTSAFLDNANRLGIDLCKVDLAVLSHGHYDHAGGLLTFSSINPEAPVYIQKNAGDDFYVVTREEEKYIGIDKKILDLPKIRMVEGNLKLDDEVSLFSQIVGRKFFARGNRSLKRKENDGSKERYIEDNFDHEQCLVIQSEGKTILFSGCAHNGIVNILEEYNKIYPKMPDVVITGFHMMQNRYSDQDVENIKAVAHELTKTNAIYYSGHCTGEYAFQIMKEIMGEQLIAIHSGDEIMV